MSEAHELDVPPCSAEAIQCAISMLLAGAAHCDTRVTTGRMYPWTRETLRDREKQLREVAAFLESFLPKGGGQA